MALEEYRKQIANLSVNEQKLRKLYLRKLALGEIQGPPTEYASLDKPWLKYYDEKYLNKEISKLGIYDFLQLKNYDRNIVAINYFGNKITYNELFNRIDVVAKSFMEMGINEGDIVTLLLANTPENVICIYALNKIGAVPNLVDLRQKDDKLVHYINSTDSKMVIPTDLFLENLDKVADRVITKKIVVASPFDSMPKVLRSLIKLTKKEYKPQNISTLKWKEFEKIGLESSMKCNYVSKDSDIACIAHTSGTTGTPKGVVLSNKCFNAMINQYEDVIVKVKKGDKILCQAPPFLVYSALMSLHLPLSLNVTLEMIPNYEPNKFADNIYKHKTAHAVAGPADWNNFLECKKVLKRDYSFLVTMGSGSDKIDTDVRHRIDNVLAHSGCNHRIFEGYGMTEVGSAAVTNLPYHIVDDSVGVPLTNMTLMIYDNDANCELEYGKIGEICLSGDTMMKGYYKNDEATMETIKIHSDGTKWVHTGDLGYVDKNGNLFLKGRIKRIIVSHEGFKISPLDIEKVLMKTGIVSNCCVVGVNDEEHGRGAFPVANVVLNSNIVDDDDIIIKKLMDYCKESLSEDRYIPKKIIIRKELPLTDVGKVDYRKLETLCKNDEKSKVKRK